MLNFGKAVRVILVAMAPVLATAQTLKMSPPVQPTPTPATGAAASTTPASPAKPAQQPQPNSPRFVTSDNFYRANTKPQTPNATAPVQPKPSAAHTVPPATQQPVAAPVPAPVAAQQPAVPQPIENQSPAVASSAPDGTTPAPEPTATVDFAKGQLTVVSQNATLGMVLKLVAAKTGAAVGLAPELQNEPVAGQIGPGTVREVITQLLDSPKIDYIIMGNGSDPDSLQRIVVQPRRSSGQGTMAANIPARPAPQLDENGHLPNGLTPEESTMSQDQIRENWKRIREQNIQAEILKQKQDREREQVEAQNESQQQPPPQPEPQPTPQPQDNPQQ